MSLDDSKDIQSLVSMVNFTRFELTYLDSGNVIPFPIFMMQTFSPSQKIMIV